VETHGRQAACGDVTRTVGWFTAQYPLVVEVDRTSAPLDQARTVAQDLARVPDGGVGFGACLRYAAAEVRAELAATPPALVGVNYLGRFDRDLPGGVLRIAGLGSAADRSPRAERAHPVEVYGTVLDGTVRLGVNWVDAPSDGVDEPAVTALLGQLRSVIGAAIAAVSPGSVPLNAQQRGMLVDALAHQATGRYVEQLCWTWHGPLDPTRFRAAWRHAMGLHEALKGRIDRTGTPTMVIEPEVEVPIHSRDGDTGWERVVADDRAAGFDLAAAPLWRVTLQPAGGGHRVLLTFHHVLLDGWSVALVVSDFYRAYLGDPRPGPLGAPGLSAHARWVAGRDRDSAARFWGDLLRDTTPATSPGIAPPAAPTPALPAVLPAAPAGPGRLELRLPDAPLAAARGVAAPEAVTDSTLFQALWAALLWRFAGGGGDRTVACGVTLWRGADLAGIDLIAGMLVTTSSWSSAPCGRTSRCSNSPTGSATGCSTSRPTSGRRPARSTTGAAGAAARRCSRACSCTRTTRSTSAPPVRGSATPGSP
jgi:non-ribosomal peptide synthase protein (TIGR01720 family)